MNLLFVHDFLISHIDILKNIGSQSACRLFKKKSHGLISPLISEELGSCWNYANWGLGSRVFAFLSPSQGEAKAASHGPEFYTITFFARSFYFIISNEYCQFFFPKVSDLFHSFSRKCFPNTQVRGIAE